MIRDEFGGEDSTISLLTPEQYHLILATPLTPETDKLETLPDLVRYLV